MIQCTLEKLCRTVLNRSFVNGYKITVFIVNCLVKFI